MMLSPTQTPLPWIALLFSLSRCHGFSTPAAPSLSSTQGSEPVSNSNNSNNNILILDHININHERGRHDWVRAFYGEEFLGCAWDPRKAENLSKGRKTLWANGGAHQFHLSEGAPDAQVLEGIVTVVHPSLSSLRERCAAIASDDSSSVLTSSSFSVEDDSPEALVVTDPWGTHFRIVEGEDSDRDPRGSQPGEPSEGMLAIRDLTVYVPADANLAGIGRFYRDVLGADLVDDDNSDAVRVRMGPYQTLSFVPKASVGVDAHVDLREIVEENDDDDERAAAKLRGTSTNLGNYGVHISLYVANLPACYQRAHDLGLTYVNTRFSRRAYTLEEAVGDCMFRCLDVVDPENAGDGPILRLEHEVRSVLKKDGTKYKSCPFDEIPLSCVTL
mmetsp:Transcript_3860/g.10986  ORF Transcript_3860/g.10986 Transcript_3860/m.10986 type:complete len:388 (+) Transcript_3860:591-1754(+)